MKHLLIVLFFITASFSLYAQKPTKQETMDWIGNTLLKYKLTDCPTDQNSNFAYANGILTYSHDYSVLNHFYETKVTIYLSKVLSWEVQGSGFKLIGSGIERDAVYDVNRRERSTDWSAAAYAGAGCGFDGFYFVDENNIKERFVKALNTLIEYNKQALPKEAF